MSEKWQSPKFAGRVAWAIDLLRSAVGEVRESISANADSNTIIQFSCCSLERSCRFVVERRIVAHF